MLRPDAASYVVLIPSLDDWDALRSLLPLLDAEFSSASLNGRVLIIDDGSESELPSDLVESRAAFQEIEVLHLRQNIGHQRAIAVGLAYVAEHVPCTAVVVMDADGEDIPADVPRLIDALFHDGGEYAVFAKRARRTESITFRISYQLYCGLHRLLTGLRVEVGNFSVVPFGLVRRLGSVAEMGNHYAAAVVHAGMNRKLVPMDRGRRLRGTSRMNYFQLVAHGLRALSVFPERIVPRLFVCALIVGALATVAVGVRAGLLALGVLLLLVLAVTLRFRRPVQSFLPSRDYTHFVDSLTTIPQ